MGQGKDVAKEVQKYGQEKFFAPEMNAYDLPMTEMIELAKAARAAGAEVDSLTGRTDDGRPGTLAELQRMGLPDADDAHLTMKPDLDTPTADDKAQKFGEWLKEDVGIGFFITESHRDIRAIQEQQPAVQCVLLDSPKERNEPPVADGTPVWPSITGLRASRWEPWAA